MRKSRVWLVLVSLMLTAALVLAGCNNNSKSPQEALQSAMKKSAELKSYSFSGSMKIEELTMPIEGDAARAGVVFSMLKDADLSWKGAYRADPMHMEMTLSLALQGDMAINFNMPIVLKSDKMWIRIPNIPFLPLPESIAGKFLELDMKQMAEESGQPMPNIDPGKSQKFANDLMGIIFKNIDEEEYLSDVKVKDAGLPDGVDAKQVVRFHIGKNQVEPLVNTLIEKIVPEIIKLLSDNAEYRDMLNLKPEDLEEAKQALEEANQEDISEGMEEFNKAVQSLDITANIGIDANEYPVYSDVHVNASIDADGQPVTFAFKVVSQTSDINKDVALEYENGPADAITMDELQEQLGGLFGGIEGL